ncbi:MAG: DNA methylase [Betaproteobacteria bacterium]|nr:MAG: DNA methylase [Betaproteobacteria bacterium]
MPTNAIIVARALRRSSTDAERLLWSKLRDRRLNGYKFKRQVPIGRYVADFVCLERMLIVEVDGGQHADRVASDRERTKELEALGYRVLRFWNNEVMGNLQGVQQTILRELAAAPHPNPLPMPGERE